MSKAKESKINWSEVERLTKLYEGYLKKEVTTYLVVFNNAIVDHLFTHHQNLEGVIAGLRAGGEKAVHNAIDKAHPRIKGSLNLALLDQAKDIVKKEFAKLEEEKGSRGSGSPHSFSSESTKSEGR